MKVNVLVDTLTETVPDSRAKTLLDTLSDINAKALMNRLRNTLAEAEAELLIAIFRPKYLSRISVTV